MGRRRTPRALQAEERALWAEIARSTNPLSGRTAPMVPSPVALPEPVATPPARPEPPSADEGHRWLAPFRVGERAAPAAGEHFGPLPGPSDPRRPAAPRMDARALTRMVRGRLTPEARLDLHGLTLAEAQPALGRFVHGAHAAGVRLVLVITGKGRTGRASGHPAEGRAGALRREVPLWLARPPLAPMVLQVVPAHARHGGDGALYVYLARKRG